MAAHIRMLDEWKNMPLHEENRLWDARLRVAETIRMVHDAPLSPEDLVLDLACGQGDVSLRVARSLRRPSEQLFMVDRSDSQLTAARDKLRDFLSPRELAKWSGHQYQADLTNTTELQLLRGALPPMNVIFMHGFLNHVRGPHRKNLLEELAKFLQLGGHIVVDVELLSPWLRLELRDRAAQPSDGYIVEIVEPTPEEYHSASYVPEFVDLIPLVTDNDRDQLNHDIGRITPGGCIAVSSNDIIDSRFTVDRDEAWLRRISERGQSDFLLAQQQLAEQRVVHPDDGRIAPIQIFLDRARARLINERFPDREVMVGLSQVPNTYMRVLPFSKVVVFKKQGWQSRSYH